MLLFLITLPFAGTDEPFSIRLIIVYNRLQRADFSCLWETFLHLKEAFSMKLIRFNFQFFSLLLLGFILTACNLSTATQPPKQNLIATAVHETASVLLAQTEAIGSPTETLTAIPIETATAESLPTETPSPTQTFEPTSTPTNDENRIMFAPGNTFATVRGQVQENTTKEYILQISKGQMLSLSLESSGKTPVLAVSGEDGKELLSAANGYTWYLTTVQKTQDFTVSIVPTGAAADFTLHVATPIDVNFDVGATSKTFQGLVEPDDIVEFRAYALQGQKAKVTLSSISGQASLHIYGLSDLVNYVEVDSRAKSWEATLPESQNYIIKVLANSQFTEFTLKIEFLNQ